MAPDRGNRGNRGMRWRWYGWLAWLALAAGAAPWSFAVERSSAVQVRPEGHPGHEPWTQGMPREGVGIFLMISMVSFWGDFMDLMDFGGIAKPQIEMVC